MLLALKPNDQGDDIDRSNRSHFQDRTSQDRTSHKRYAVLMYTLS